MSSVDPDISVVMSVFNGSRHLRESVESILVQEGANFEFVIVDDGSTDDTPDLLQEYAAMDARIRIVRQTNVGLTRALIHGCRLARGRYIARQDADDVSLPGRLRQQAALLDRENDVSFVSCWSELIGPEGEPLLTFRRPGDATVATRRLCVDRQGPEHGSVMFRRDAYEAVGGYREIFYYAQDSDLWLRLAVAGKINYVQQVLFRYRVSPASISGSLHAVKLPYARLIDDLYAARQQGQDEGAIIARAELSVGRESPGFRSSASATNYFIGRCLFNRRDSRCVKYLRACLREDMGHYRALVILPIAKLLSPFWSKRSG